MDLYTKPISAISYADLDVFAGAAEPLVEGERLDAKAALNDRVIESIVGMGNADGGIILIGVDEIEERGQKTKRIRWPALGVDKPSIQDALMSMCHSTIRPNYVPAIRLIDIPGQPGRYVLFVRVESRRVPRPLWHEHKGVLVRIGDQNRPADLDTLKKLLLEPARLAEAENYYQQWRGSMTASSGGPPFVGLVALYPAEAIVFETNQKRSLAGAVAKYFDFGPAEAAMRPTRVFLEVDSHSRQPDRRILAHFRKEGVASLRVYHPSTREIPWDWVLGETYIGLLCLRDAMIGAVYPVVDTFTMTLAMGGLPPEGIAIDRLQGGVKAVASSGVRFVQEERDLDSNTDIWTVAREFLELVLADTGCLQYEAALQRLQRDGFMGTYFHPEGPFRRPW